MVEWQYWSVFLLTNLFLKFELYVISPYKGKNWNQKELIISMQLPPLRGPFSHLPLLWEHCPNRAFSLNLKDCYSSICEHRPCAGVQVWVDQRPTATTVRWLLSGGGKRYLLRTNMLLWVSPIFPQLSTLVITKPGLGPLLSLFSCTTHCCILSESHEHIAILRKSPLNTGQRIKI